MSSAKVYADFHNLDDSNRLSLTCAGTRQDLERQGIELRDGLVLTFYMDDADDQGRLDDIMVEGVVRHHDIDQVWVAVVDWSRSYHASDERTEASGAAPVAVLPAPD